MSRPPAVSALLSLVLLSVPALASAKIPERIFCRVPTVLVGSNAGALMPSCAESAAPGAGRSEGFFLCIREASNGPMAFEQITLDLSAAGCRLFGDDRPGMTVDCVAKTIRGFTNPRGEITFAPRFGGVENAALVRIFVEAFPLAEVPARSTDLDADGTTGIADFARVAANLLSGASDPSTDFDPCAGPTSTTTLPDFALFARELLRSTSAAVACP